MPCRTTSNVPIPKRWTSGCRRKCSRRPSTCASTPTRNAPRWPRTPARSPTIISSCRCRRKRSARRSGGSGSFGGAHRRACANRACSNACELARQTGAVSVSWWFLAVSLLGALFTVIALRPPRRPVALLGVTFFAAWLTTELAVVHLAWQLVATIVFVWAGALQAWPGWVGLAITLASWTGLAFLITGARRTDRVFDDAL